MQTFFRRVAIKLTLLAIAGVYPFASYSQTFHQPTVKEIQRIITVITADARCPKEYQIISVGPADADKALSGDESTVARTQTILRDRTSHLIHEVFSDAKTGAVVEWRRIGVVQPVLTDSDCDSAEAIVRNTSGWLQGLTRRGLTPDDVVLECVASGIPVSTMPFRIVRVYTYMRPAEGSSIYGRPVEGLVCVVNLDGHRLVEFYDRELGPIPEQSGSSRWIPENIKSRKSKLLKFIKPPSSIAVSGNTIQWNGWKLSALIHSSEGLVIYSASFMRNGELNSVAHRLSLSEVVTTYGDTALHWNARYTLAVGEYGLGANVSQLTPGYDVPQNSKTLSAVILQDGKPVEIPDAIAVYETDEGVLWRHTDSRSGNKMSYPNKTLNITSISTVRNCDYVFTYKFHSDGSIDIEAGSTGLSEVRSVIDTSGSLNREFGQSLGTLTGPNLLLPVWQQFYCFRLDLDVDGPRNRVSEFEITSAPDFINKYGAAMQYDNYEWLFEKEAQSEISAERNRSWIVWAANSRNALGGTPGYSITPKTYSVPLLTTGHPLRSRADFLRHSLWVTRYHPEEMLAAGPFPNQNVQPAGVSIYASNNQRLRGEDVVVWLTTTLVDIPALEDYPLRKIRTTGVHIAPFNFDNSSVSPR